MKIGLIGAGFIGHIHANAYAKLSEAKVVAVTDLDLGRAQEIADMLGARVVASAAELMADPEVEAVDICVPTPYHCELVLAAAAAHKHVLCEKPIARTLEQADQMIAACRAAGVTFMVGHVMRWEPTAEKAREVVESGVLGQVKLVRMTLGGSFPTWGWGNWFADEAKSGGPFLDSVIHDFDWINAQFGPVERVYARRMCPGRLEKGDYGLVIMRMKNGMMAHVEALWNAPQGFPFEDKYEIAGLEGLYEYGEYRPPVDLWLAGQDGEGRHVTEAPLTLDAFAEEIRHFVHCCETGAAPRVTLAEAREAVRIALAAIESAATGQPVQL